MIKNIFNFLADKIQKQKNNISDKIELNKKLSKVYPREFVFNGEYNKSETTQDGVSFNYMHREAFLADSNKPTEITKFIRITGDNAGNELPILFKKFNGKYVDAYVKDNGVLYSIFLSKSNTFEDFNCNSRDITLKDIIMCVNEWNDFSKSCELEELGCKEFIDREFGKN